MTSSEQREAVIAAAKDDARQAVDALLDAIGRILLAHIDAHADATPPPVAVSGSQWTLAEDELLRRHYPTLGPEGVIRAGVNRSGAAINDRARKLGLTRLDRWTDAEDALVRRHYALGGSEAVIAAGVDRSETAIYHRARRLGVRNYTTPTTPAPPEALTRQVLAALIERDADDQLLDADDLTSAEQTALRKLRRDNLATQEAPGLWRPTLAGLAAARNNQ